MLVMNLKTTYPTNIAMNQCRFHAMEVLDANRDSIQLLKAHMTFAGSNGGNTYQLCLVMIWVAIQKIKNISVVLGKAVRILTS